jgi:hypothetical protein
MIDTVQLFEDFSPIPFASGYSTVYVDDPEKEDAVNLTDSMVRRMRGDEHVISMGKQWPVRAGDIARAYREELARAAALARAVAARIVLYGRRCGDLFDVRSFPETAEQPRFARRVNVLLRHAVEVSAKNPNPNGPMIFNRAFWHGRLHLLLDLWLESPSEIGWVDTPFVHVAAAALRERANGRSMRAVVVPFRVREMPRLRTLIEETAAFLDSVALPWDVDAYRRIAEFFATLRGADAPLEGELLFVGGDGAFRCLCFGLPLAKPEGGYPMRLHDGSVVRLPRPPWTMGMMTR